MAREFQDYVAGIFDSLRQYPQTGQIAPDLYLNRRPVSSNGQYRERVVLFARGATAADIAQDPKVVAVQLSQEPQIRGQEDWTVLKIGRVEDIQTGVGFSETSLVYAGEGGLWKFFKRGRDRDIAPVRFAQVLNDRTRAQTIVDNVRARVAPKAVR